MENLIIYSTCILFVTLLISTWRILDAIERVGNWVKSIRCAIALQENGVPLGDLLGEKNN